MAQTQRIQGRSTTVFTDNNGMTKVVYHRTPVVSFNADKIILNTGGWRSVTTKLRMNQAANQFRLGYQVYQKDFDWFVSTGPDDPGIPFNGQTMQLKRPSC